MKSLTLRESVYILAAGFLCTLLTAFPSWAQFASNAQNLNAAITPLSSGGGIATGAVVQVNGIPVNIYRGVVSPNFLLASLAGRDLVVPVTLGYDGQGVRVSSMAGEVGTGWALTAGGDIACDVQDEPDESRGRSIDWLRVLQTKPGGDGLERVYQEYMCRYGVKEYSDTEYDIYRLNANGLQARFLIKDGVVLVLDNPSVKITPVFSAGAQSRISSFTVTDNSGFIYTFGSYEITTSRTVSSRVGSTRTPLTHTSTYASRWVLTKIESANHEIANLYYTYGNPFSYSVNSLSDYQALTRNNVAYSEGVAMYNNITTVSVNSPLKIIEISSPYGRILFERSLGRKDISDNALTTISTLGTDGKIITRTKLNYSYFISPGSTTPTEQNSRLRLDRITLLADNCAADVTRFDYFQAGEVSRQSLRQDYYGFYNNNTANTLMPPVPGQPQLTSGNRNADLSQMVNCALKQINYGAGSSVALEYSLHLPDNANSQFAGDGLRIKKITANDGNGHTLTEELTYDQTNNGITPQCYDFRDFRTNDDCANLNQDGAYTYHRCVFRSSTPIAGQAGDIFGYPNVTVKHANQSKTAYTFSSYSSNQDTWNPNSTKFQVFIFDRRPNGGGDLDGNNCFNFNWVPQPCNGRSYNVDQRSHYARGMYPQLSIMERPYGVLNDRSGYRGALLSQQDYAANGTLLRGVSNEYNFPTFSADIGAVSARIGAEQDYSGGGSSIYNYYYNVKFYTHAQAWARLDKQTVIVYDQNLAAFAVTTNAISDVTEYTYDANRPYASFLPSQVRTYSTATPNVSKVVRTRRADEFLVYSSGNQVPPAGTFIEHLLSRNMLSTPVEQFTTLNGANWQSTITQSVFSQFRQENNRLLPDQAFSWQGCSDGSCPFSQAYATEYTAGAGNWYIAKDSRYQLTSRAARYDAAGNLLNLEDRAGLAQAQIWGYAGLLPIAQVSNALAGSGDISLPTTTGHTSFEFDAASDAGTWDNLFQYSNEAKTGTRSISLSSPNAIYGPGKIFTFAPAQQRGKWQFSCWAKVPLTSGNASVFNLVTVLKDANGNDLKWTGPSFSAGAGQPWKLCTGTFDFDDASVRSLIPAGQYVRLQCYVWISGGQPLLVDEYRARPASARMITQTYLPGIGKSSETDANDVTLYYEYADDHQLAYVRDEAGSIIKRLVRHKAQDNEDATLTAYVGSNSAYTTNNPNYFIGEVLECNESTYYWNFGDGATNITTATSSAHSYQQPGTYTVTVTAVNPTRAPLEQTISITIYDAFAADITVDSGSLYGDVCYNPPPVVLRAQPTNGCGAPYTYQWQENVYGYWSDISGGQNETVTVYHGVVGSKSYQCIVKDKCGNVVTPQTFMTTVRNCNGPIEDY